ncbi:MAG: 3-dehydroquinate synthase [Chloroflexia bacterium]
MNPTSFPNVVLWGFMGTGKSTLGSLIARRLGRPFIDTDRVIETEMGLSVSDIFARYGESIFREREREVCARLSATGGQVIAVGGGALIDPTNRAALASTGIIVLLTCEHHALATRLLHSAERGERPLLGGNIEATVHSLLVEREAAYSSIPLRVDTTYLTPEQAADQAIELYNAACASRQSAVGGRREAGGGLQEAGAKCCQLLTADCRLVRAPGGDYHIVAGQGTLGELGRLAAGLHLGHRVVVATDSNVQRLYAERVAEVLRAADFEPHIVAMPAGEVHKQWASVSLFIDSFLEADLDRGGWVLALGGGVVGDTAGFAATIYMRGVRLVQVPTTLLAMADSSVGGKVGVDHPGGKNLLGAFKQPDLVVIDPTTLATLPSLQIACGMAEVIKAAVIGDPELFAILERSDLNQVDYLPLLLRAVAVKRNIVEADPYEASDRALLNLGHTFGHALETCTRYARPHGVAVAQGMALAFRVSARLGMCRAEDEIRLCEVLARWHLPSRWGGPDLPGKEAAGQVFQAMHSDKKRRDGRLRLVLPERIGRVKIVEGVDPGLIISALEELQ